ncbi:MAG: baseplate J/gp47 family protein, partial [Burkholderiaceae bacterium]
FRRKTYPEVAESLLNRLLGGVSAEAHPYPPPGNPREPYTHPLERAPVQQITAVWGARNGASQRFERDADYRLAVDAARIVWIAGGQRPDDGTAFEVHYLPRQREAGVNDLYPGSVVRTLLEAVALETAGLYAQMQSVYDAGFIDTASGSALDHVVALLGVERVRAGRNSTELRFTRARNARGAITLPAGTRAATADGAIEYETLADVTLADGQASAKVASRDLLSTNDGLPAESLTLLTRPVAGIETVTNPAASSRLDRDETDAELRTRARRFLVGAERGTLSAIEAAVGAEGLRCELNEPAPGVVDVQLQSGALDPTRRARLDAAILRVRPAGVVVNLLDGSAPSRVDLELRLSTAAGLAPAELRGIQETIRGRYADYFKQLPIRSDGSASKLIGLAMGVPGVEDARLVSAKVASLDTLDAARGILALAALPTELGEVRISDPALATGVTLAVRYHRGQPIPDQTALQAALEAAIASVNALAAQDDAALDAQRVLGWPLLTRLLPLPGFAPATYEQQRAGSPGASDADIGDYTVQWVFTRPTGASQLLGDAAAPAFAPATTERLSVARVTVDVKPKP